MQCYTVYLYLETALHVSGGTSTHHQENKLYEPLKANFFPLRSTRFNIKKFYIVLALRWGFFYGSQKRQRLLLYISLTDWVFFNRGGKCLQRGTDRFLT